MADKLIVSGARGASVTEIARRTGNWGVVPTDSDQDALDKFAGYAITENAGFQSTIPGPSNNTRLSLALLKAAAITDKTSLYDGSLWTWTLGNYTGLADDLNVVKADSTALSVGAWVRQASNAVTFRQSGTGAVARTMESKARDQVSVKDFGAIGDGTLHTVAEWIIPSARGRYANLAALQVDYPHVTETTQGIDWAASQAAVNSRVAKGGGVFFPSSQYFMTQKLLVSSYCPISLIAEMDGDIYALEQLLDNAPMMIVGAPMDHLIEYAAPDGGARGYHGAGRISGFAFADIGPTDAGSPGINTLTSALHLKDFILGTVENCTFHWLRGGAISAEYAVNAKVRNCWARYCGDLANPTRSIVLLAGLSPTYPVQAFTLDNVCIEVCYSDEYITGVTECYDLKLLHLQFEAATTEYPNSNKKFLKIGALGYLVHDCWFNRTLADAVEFTRGSFITSGVEGRGNFEVCHWANAASSGRSMTGNGNFVSVSDCTFEDNKPGPSVESTGVEFVFEGNKMYSSGAIVAIGRGAKIDNNKITQPTQVGGYVIDLDGVSQSADGNRFDDNGVAPGCGGIRSYSEGSVRNNNFDRWSANTCIRREHAMTQISGNKYGTVANAYSESAPPAAGSGFTMNGQEVLSAPGALQVLTGAGAVGLTTEITHLITTGANALTLADGFDGQRKLIVMKTAGGAGTLTPANLAGADTTITFDDVGDSADLRFTNGQWYFLGGKAVVA